MEEEISSMYKAHCFFKNKEVCLPLSNNLEFSKMVNKKSNSWLLSWLSFLKQLNDNGANNHSPPF